MLKHLQSTLKHVLRLLVYGAIGVAMALVVGFIYYLDSRTDLSVWHHAHLDEEFTVNSPIASFEEYIALEDRLFAQLDEVVYAQTGPAGDDRVNRYKRGSLSDPGRWPTNWNRSYELPVDTPRASVLLLHGLSDSPYSLRHLAQRLHGTGVHALGLRIPGHGTAPSGLLNVTWQDMAAAVRLAMRHLAEQNGDRPIHVIGYSNGAALAVQYALSALDDPTLPRIDRLVLLSPQIGVTPAAAMAIWQARLGRLLGLEKLAWNEILPEYDPFKYGSFAVNAGNLSHRLTAEIQRHIGVLQEGGKLDSMPPVLAFSSVVDATVLAPALLSNLFNRLSPGGHELVLFDINARIELEHLLSWDPEEMLTALQNATGTAYELSLVTNESPNSRNVVEQRWTSGMDSAVITELSLQWPENVYSLSHVALPFAPGDPLYGSEASAPSPGVKLGNLALRGESHVLKVSPTAMLRLRWNPFYSYLEQRTLEFLDVQ